MNQNSRPNRDLSRRQLLRYSGIGVAAAAGSSFLVACGGDDDGGGGGGGGGQQSSGGTLIHGATGGGSKDTLDPHAPVTNPDIARVSNLYEPLLFWNNNYELEPALAESVEASKDAKTWTIKMRQGVTFHNGKDVTAEDAWFSIQRVVEPEGAALRGRPALHDPRLRVEQGRSTTTTLQLVLKPPYAHPRLAAGGVHPRHHPRPTSTSRTPSAPVPSPTSRSTPARPAPSPSTPTTGATRRSSTSCRSRTSATTAPRSTPCRRARSRPSTTCPTTSSTPSRALAAAPSISETGAWVPFTMRVDRRRSTTSGSARRCA